MADPQTALVPALASASLPAHAAQSGPLRSVMMRITCAEQEPILQLRRTSDDELVAQALADAQLALAPAGAEAAHQVLAFIGTTLDIAAPTAAVRMVYAKMLGNLPLDLLEKAVMGVLETHVYPTMPKPADFLKHVTKDVAERENAVIRIQRHIKRLKIAGMMHPEVTPQRRGEPAPKAIRQALAEAGCRVKETVPDL
jgi:hypothetical protein